MSPARAERLLVLLLAGLLLTPALAGCGKKAPLRLPEDRPVVEAAAPRARVREGRVTLDFQAPRHRLFPEREDPWVLARILRQSGAAGETIEVGTLLETGGFAFGAPLSWSDQEQPAGLYSYRVEFRDRARRRRALAGPVSVSWERTPAAPQGLAAAGGTRTIALSWDAPGTPGEAARYVVYRREPPSPTAASIAPEPVAEGRYLDSRVEPGREYCYEVRGVLSAGAVAVEGPAAAEVCARAAAEQPAPARPPDAAP